MGWLNEELVDIGGEGDDEDVPDTEFDEKTCVKGGPDFQPVLYFFKGRIIRVFRSGLRADVDT